MKVIFVKLPNEAGHVAVLEVLRQDGSRKFLALVEDVRVNNMRKMEMSDESHLNDDK